MDCFGYKKRKSREKNDETTAVGNDPGVTSADAKHKGRPASASQVCPVVLENNQSPASALQAWSEVPEIDQSNRQCKLHERCINRQRASDSKVDELEASITRLETEIEEKNEEVRKMTEENLKTTEAKAKEHQRIAEKLQAKISRQKMEIQELTDIKNELLTRLSAVASAKLTDGNANIADLSDENRPTKLAERYSELYDNEWTDAYEVLTAGKDVSEQDACHILLKALCSVYITCKQKANDDRENVTGAVNNFLGVTEPSTELMKHLKDQRKKNYGGHIKQLKRDVKESLHKVITEKKTRRDKRMKQFLNKGIELCWLMVIQDPPVFLDVRITNRYGEKHDNNTLKPYTQSGKYIDYIVWPALYLNEGGNILCKGIAQCKSDVTADRSSNDPLIFSMNQEIASTPKIEEELLEQVKETKIPETNPANAAKAMPDAHTYHGNTETGTCRGEKGSTKAKLSSVVTPSDTENENGSRRTSLVEMLNTEDQIEPDQEKTMTEREKQELMDANCKTNAGNVDSVTSQETTITMQKEKGRRQKKETTPTRNNRLSAETTMYESSTKVNPRQEEENGSNSKTISEANPTGYGKGKMSSNTRSTIDAKCREDLKPSTSSSNTTAVVRSSIDQTSKQMSYQVIGNGESHTKGTNIKSEKYSPNNNQTKTERPKTTKPKYASVINIVKKPET